MVCPRILPDAVGHANLAISVVVLAELRDGAELHPTRSDDIHADIDDFCRRLAVVPWSETAAVHYGRSARYCARPVPPSATWIS